MADQPVRYYRSKSVGWCALPGLGRLGFPARELNR
jgi:hypothetical protein